MSDATPIRVLLIEESSTDADINERALTRAGMSIVTERVETLTGVQRALRTFRPDVILSDFSAQKFDAFAVLGALRDARMDTPLILVTGPQPEEIAAQIIKEGAADYLLKSHMTRLPNAVEHAMERRDAERARRQAIVDLEKFRLAVEQTSEHIVMTDADGRIVYANPAVERITGYAAAACIGRKPGELWGGHMEREFYERFWHRIAIERLPFVGEVRNRRKGGEEYVASMSVTPVMDMSGRVQFYVGVERDITREKEIDRVKSEFVSLASHQLRAPLTGIKWYTELLADTGKGQFTPTQMQYLTQIAQSTTRMAALVDELLNISRMESGTAFAVARQRVDFVPLLTPLIADIRDRARVRDVTVRVVGMPASMVAEIDPEKFVIAVQNILDNAVKYSVVGGMITITYRAEDGQHVLSVRDTGIGIPAHQQHRVFEKFFRGENARVLEANGTGLGLYAANAIIAAHQGTITFTSSLGKGTTFTVTLPAVPRVG